MAFLRVTFYLLTSTCSLPHTFYLKSSCQPCKGGIIVPTSQMRNLGFASFSKRLQFTQVVSAGDRVETNPLIPTPWAPCPPHAPTHDPHPLLRPVFLVSLSKTAHRKGPDGQAHRIPSGVRLMLKHQLTLPSEGIKVACRG